MALTEEQERVWDILADNKPPVRDYVIQRDGEFRLPEAVRQSIKSQVDAQWIKFRRENGF